MILLVYTVHGFKCFGQRLNMSPTATYQNNAKIVIHPSTVWNNKIVILKKTTLQLYFKTFIEKINSGNLIMY